MVTMYIYCIYHTSIRYLTNKSQRVIVVVIVWGHIHVGDRATYRRQGHIEDRVT